MATSGRIGTGRHNNTQFYFQWQQAWQDVGGNYTRINWQAGINMSAQTWWYSNAIKINGVWINGSGNITSGTWSNINGTGDRELRSGSWDIGHNADGSKNFGASISGWLYGGGDLSTAGDWWLDTIPRASQPSVNSWPNNSPNVNVGASVTIHTNRASSSFTHNVVITAGSFTKNLGGGHTNNAVWNPTEAEITALYNAMPNAMELNGTVTLTTWNGGTNIGTKTCPIKFIIPAGTANPTLPDFTFSDTNATIVAITGNDQIMVQGKSTVSAVVSSANKMVVQKGATPVNYTATLDGTVNTQPYSASASVTMPLGAIAGSGSRTLSVRANDSRSNSAVVSKEIQVLPYAKPELTLSAVRENNFEATTEVKIDGIFSRLTIGASDKNAITTGSLRYRTRQDGGAWGSWVNKTFTQSAGTFTVVPFFISLVNSSAFDLEVEVSDKLETVSETISIARGVPVFMISDNTESIGINTMPSGDRPGIHLIPGVDKIFDYIYPVGTIYENVNPTNPSEFFGGTWVAFGTGRVTVGVDGSQSEFNTVEKTGGHKLLHAHVHNVVAGFYTYVGSGAENSIGGGSGAGVTYSDRASVGNGRYGITTTTGGGNGQNLQPYVTVYRWKRTA